MAVPTRSLLIVKTIFLILIGLISDLPIIAIVKCEDHKSVSGGNEYRCSLEPRVEILNYSHFGKGESGNFTVLAETETGKLLKIPTNSGVISIECTSTEPVSWDFHGYLEPEVIKSIVHKRSSFNSQNTSTFCYRAVLHLDMTAPIAGTIFGGSGQQYNCIFLTKTTPRLVAKPFLFVYGREDLPKKLLKPKDSNFILLKSNVSAEVTIPCIGNHPNITVELLKEGNNPKVSPSSALYSYCSSAMKELSEVRDREYTSSWWKMGFQPLDNETYNVSYDAKNGFTISLKTEATGTLNISAEKLLTGHYRCISFSEETKSGAGQNESTVTSSSSSDILDVALRSQSLQTSKRSQKLQIVLRDNENVIPMNEDEDADEEDYHSSVCQRFVCSFNLSRSDRYSSSHQNQKLSMSILQCNSPAHCQLIIKFLEDARVDTPKQLIIDNDFEVCNKKDKKEVTNDFSLPQDRHESSSSIIIPSTVMAGIGICRTSDHLEYQYQLFYRSVNIYDSRVTLYSESAPEPEHHWQLNERMEIYVERSEDGTGEVKLNLKCIVSSFTFARGLKWLVKYTNGSSTLREPNILSQKERHFTTMVSEMDAVVSDSAADLDEVICRAPLWDSNEWVDLPYLLTSPKIAEESHTTLNVYETGEDITIIRCSAEGSPCPTIRWYKDDQLYVDATQNSIIKEDFNEAGNVTISEIYFSKAVYNESSIRGVYTCNATNIKSSAFRYVTIIVKPHFPTHWYYIITGSLVISLVILTGLFLKYRQNLTFYQNAADRLGKYEEHFTFLRFKYGHRYVPRIPPGDVSDAPINDENLELAVMRTVASSGVLTALDSEYDDQRYEVPPEDLIFPHENLLHLGEGHFGLVIQATLVVNNVPTPVAVKMLKEWDTAKAELLLSEIKILAYVGKHENVVCLHGSVIKRERRIIQAIIEYCQKGSLELFLRRKRCIVDIDRDGHLIPNITDFAAINLSATHYIPQDQFSYLRTSDLIRWAYQFACGMNYLRSKNIIHGDLAARNLLLTETSVLKITDFGLSEIKNVQSISTPYSEATTTDWPWRILAVECCDDPTKLTYETDVWAFGITLWEIFSLASVSPYHPNFTDCTPTFKEHLRSAPRILNRAQYATDQIDDIMMECWNKNPSERPTFSALVERLRILLPGNLLLQLPPHTASFPNQE